MSSEPANGAIAVDETTAAPADGWRQDAQGRFYVSARGRSGIIYRKNGETVDEAYARDAKGPRDTKPKKAAAPKSVPKPPKPPAPTQQSLKELEYALAEGLSAPAMICAGLGDTWAANHFTTQGPILARNLVKASEYNPWLRAKLEAAMMGEDFMVKFITAAGVGGALFAYAIPPIIYYVNPSFIDDDARAMFGVPVRESREPDAEAAAPAAAAGPAAGPAS